VADGDGADSMLRLARDRRRRDEALPEDEAEAARSSWLHEKEV
jgi:hypothetical protein